MLAHSCTWITCTPNTVYIAAPEASSLMSLVRLELPARIPEDLHAVARLSRARLCL
jgi:hypothetical protein